MKAYGIILFSIFFFTSLANNCFAQTGKDTTLAHSDSLLHDSIQPITAKLNTLDFFLKKNKFLNTLAPSVSMAAKEKNKTGKEFLFYLLGIVILLVAIFKVFYTKYFNNIFRVFFNTSLQQNQLTDLLLQAKLPSLIFNVFFVISGGLYAWLIFDHYHLLKGDNHYILIGLSILFVAIIYFGKFLSLKII